MSSDGSSAIKDSSMKSRRANVTGVPKLSIGTTKNDRGAILSRYSVNYKVGDKVVCKSFYFGAKSTQIDAYKSACKFMIDNGLTDYNQKRLKAIYSLFKHEMLI